MYQHEIDNDKVYMQTSSQDVESAWTLQSIFFPAVTPAEDLFSYLIIHARRYNFRLHAGKFRKTYTQQYLTRKTYNLQNSPKKKKKLIIKKTKLFQRKFNTLHITIPYNNSTFYFQRRTF